MGRGNDAIPSWSGYNFQGKMTLLVVMQTINGALPNEIGNYSVELEKTEDFVIFKSGFAQSFYQVKAYPTKSTWRSYHHGSNLKKSALEKLVNHRDATKNRMPGAKCFLCVCNEVNNWDDSSNPYKTDISLYKYGGSVASLSEVSKNIKKELEKFISANKFLQQDVDVLYSMLCCFLNEKIVSMHESKQKQRQYGIPLSEIVEALKQTHQSQRQRSEHDSNEQIYNHLAENIKDAMEEYCESVCDVGQAGKSGRCTQCGVPHGFKVLASLTDLRRYCEAINPSTCFKKTQLTYASKMDGEKFKNEIYPIFHAVKNIGSIMCEDNIAYIETALFKTQSPRLIPTLLNMTNSGNDAKSENSIQDQLKKIKNNDCVTQRIANCAITVRTDEKTRRIIDNQALDEIQITSFPNEIDQDDPKNESINPRGCCIKLVAFDEAINRFEAE